MKHSSIGPSKSHRWINCPASVKAAEGCPDSCSDAASLGTAAHTLGELTIAKGFRSPDLWDYPERIEGKADQTFPVNREMVEAVETYTNYVFENTKEGDDVLVETRFSLEHIHPELFGTNDCMIVRPMDSLHVIDYKNGSGQFVEIVDGDYEIVENGLEGVVNNPKIEDVNTQLLIYALGGLNSIIDPVRVVKLTIVQPRCEAEFKIRTVTLLARDIRAWAEDVLKPAADNCFAENPKYNIGSWCRFCPAKSTCPEQLGKAFDMVKINPVEPRQITFPLPKDLTPQQLLAINEFADAFKSWSDDVKQFIRHNLETGKMTSKELGLKLVEGRKSKVWKENYQQLILSNGILEKEELYNEPKPKSPAQLDALLKDEHGFSKQERDDLLKPAYTQQPGSPRLVPLAAKGEELKPSAQVAFEQFDNEKE